MSCNTLQLIESDGKDIKDFLSEIQGAWDDLWEKVYSADAAGVCVSWFPFVTVSVCGCMYAYLRMLKSKVWA